MKKLPIILSALVLPLFFFVLPIAAHAQACPSGDDGDCPGDMVCDTSTLQCVASDDAAAGAGNLGAGQACTTDGQCSGNLACINKVCQIDPSLEDSGTAAAGGACNPTNNGSDCPGDQTCQASSATTGTCVGATGSQASTAANAGNTNGSTGFVPLAPIPGLDANGASASASGIAQFLNNLYKFLIGIAAALAVIEIIWGGLQYATQDSVSKKGEGKERIQHALLGLVLVLSPALVFSIINPSILNLSLSLPILNTPAGTATSVGSTATGVATPDQTSGGSSLFSGQYMAVETFTTSSAAQSWNCPVSGQSKMLLSCPTVDNQTGNCTQYYAACITPSISISGESSLGTFNPTITPFPADQTTYNTYYGECERVQGELSGASVGTAAFDNGYNSGSSITCSAADLPSGTHSSADTYECRSNTQLECSVSSD